jgi:hypothetical protein
MMLLPRDWERTELKTVVVLTWRRTDGPVSVTVDETKRAFELGHGVYVPPPWPKAKYTGRGWKDRLYDDAIAALKKVFEENPK